MKFLHKLLFDFRQGQNIDLIITVIFAIILTVLNIIDVISYDWLAPLNLSLLAIFAFSLLGNRYLLEKFRDEVIDGNKQLLVSFPNSLQDELIDANELLIVGTDLRATLSNHYNLFRRKLEEGKIIKLLLMAPDSNAVDTARLFYCEPIDENYVQTLINNSLGICEELSNIPNGHIEVRLVRHSLTFGAIAIDLDEKKGSIYLWHYSFRTKKANVPKMHFHTSDQIWYEHFKEELLAIWKIGLPWQH